MDILSSILAVFVAILLLQFVAYLYALRTNRVDIVDSVWGLSFITGIISLQIVQPTTSYSVLIVEFLVLIWGIRLASHIYRRFRRSTKQDPRYTSLIERWPKRQLKLQLFVKIFLVQAILATLISLSVITLHVYQPAIGWLAVIGLVIWCIGFGFEWLSDRQLRNFLSKADRGELMTTGLWKYSRHPNYFGEVTMWWGIAIMSLSTPYWWLAMTGATTITILICFVSGIPPAEKQAYTKQGWAEYKAKTSVLIPWPRAKA